MPWGVIVPMGVTLGEEGGKQCKTNPPATIAEQFFSLGFIVFYYNFMVIYSTHLGSRNKIMNCPPGSHNGTPQSCHILTTTLLYQRKCKSMCSNYRERAKLHPIQLWPNAVYYLRLRKSDAMGS